MMDQIVKVVWDLNDNSENRYQLVYEIAELAKKLVDETQMKKNREDLVLKNIPILLIKKKIRLNTLSWLKLLKLMMIGLLVKSF